MGQTSKFLVGARVRFTAAFLRSTGQYTGSDANGRWIVQSCECTLCATGRFVAVDQPNLDNDGQRHIATGNLHAVRS